MAAKKPQQQKHTLKYATQIGAGVQPAGQEVDLWPDQLERIKVFEARHEAALAKKSNKGDE